MDYHSILPNEIINKISNLNVDFKITKPRKSKLGDCKYLKNENKFSVSLNSNLNKYQLIITLIHEIAHVISIEKYGLKIKPHGIEWKSEYKKLIEIAINNKLFPKKIESELIKSLNNIKSSHIYNYKLIKELLKNKKQKKTLENIKNGEEFKYNGNKFIKIKKLTKRYLCQNMQNKKKYYIHPLLEVQ